jgi:hypothetical protein
MPTSGWCRRQGGSHVHLQLLRSHAAKMSCAACRAMADTGPPGDDAQAFRDVAVRHRAPRSQGEVGPGLSTTTPDFQVPQSGPRPDRTVAAHRTPLGVAIGGSIRCTAKRRRPRRFSGVNCSFPSTRPGVPIFAGQAVWLCRPLPLFSRCLEASLISVNRDGSLRHQAKLEW